MLHNVFFLNSFQHLYLNIPKAKYNNNTFTTKLNRKDKPFKESTLSVYVCLLLNNTLRGCWLQYRRTPLEGTLAAWWKPSMISADTQSGPWMWGTKKVQPANQSNVFMSKIRNRMLFCLWFTGCILDSVVSEVNPATVLELGTYCGYSTVRIAMLLPPDAKLITLEFNPDFAVIARQVIAWAGQEEKVHSCSPHPVKWKFRDNPAYLPG